MGKKSRREKFSPCSFESEIYEEEYEVEINIPSTVPKNDHQRDYNRVLYGMKPMVFAVGPAGTGKTMLACYAAIQGLNDDSFKKIILTRPAVSVEEDIGYLPGTLEEKMDPWTRPIMDIFGEYYTQTDIQYMIKEKIIEICPLAYMRGRTFKDAFIIADEMQNASMSQMQMLLTRVGEGSRLIVTGDLNQSDLGPDNGLALLCDKMDGLDLKYVERVSMDDSDIRRSPAVEEVIRVLNV